MSLLLLFGGSIRGIELAGRVLHLLGVRVEAEHGVDVRQKRI